MSATPIPRTLALMIYGELDVSVIDELPPGRSPVLTYKISSGKRERAFGFIREHLDRGLQAYIVCPRVEAGEEDAGLRAATDYMLELSGGAFKGYAVGLLHGRMKAADKERTMAGFQDGTVQLLVSTTVVEVGVDVPNAVIMMVENAERFGLSQLHQLRGRVGRGKEQSLLHPALRRREPRDARPLKDDVQDERRVCHRGIRPAHPGTGQFRSDSSSTACRSCASRTSRPTWRSWPRRSGRRTACLRTTRRCKSRSTPRCARPSNG